MNKILKVLALGAMALSTIACSDFLEVNPRTQVSETEFYKTEDSDSPLTTPDMVRSGRVLQTSVKSSFNCVKKMIKLHCFSIYCTMKMERLLLM